MFVNTRGLKSIDTFYSYFEVQDLVLTVLGILLYRQIKKTGARNLRLAGIILYSLLFLYFFPDFSATFEVQRVLFFERVNGDLIDSFNLLYVWGRFPMFWMLGVSILVIGNLTRIRKENGGEVALDAMAEREG